MRVEVLTVPDCPNGPVARRHLAEALAGRADVMVKHRVVSTPEEAARYGMHGSPTILIDGRDPFAEPGAAAGLTCRLYRDADGRAQGAPSAVELGEALAAAGCQVVCGSVLWIPAVLRWRSYRQAVRRRPPGSLRHHLGPGRRTGTRRADLRRAAGRRCLNRRAVQRRLAFPEVTGAIVGAVTPASAAAPHR
jgi:hypothetical protein